MEEPEDTKSDQNRDLTPEQQFGLEILRRRTRLGMTQEEFADYIPIARTMITRIETGKVSVRIETITRIARALGVTVSALMQRVK